MAEVDNRAEFISEIAIHIFGVLGVLIMVSMIFLCLGIPMNYAIIVYLVIVLFLPLYVILTSVILLGYTPLSEDWKLRLAYLIGWCIVVLLPMMLLTLFFVGELCGDDYAPS